MRVLKSERFVRCVREQTGGCDEPSRLDSCAVASAAVSENEHEPYVFFQSINHVMDVLVRLLTLFLREHTDVER